MTTHDVSLNRNKSPARRGRLLIICELRAHALSRKEKTKGCTFVCVLRSSCSRDCSAVSLLFRPLEHAFSAGQNVSILIKTIEEQRHILAAIIRTMLRIGTTVMSYAAFTSFISAEEERTRLKRRDP